MGGYVKIPGMDQNESPDGYESNELFHTATWTKKLYIASSGIIVNFLLAWIEAIEKSRDYVQKLVANSGKVLFVGTKPQAQQVIEDQAIRADMPYVNFEALGFFLESLVSKRQKN